MLKALLKKWKKPLLVLGATGFSTTVVACYGPPAYTYNTELENSAVKVLSHCIDMSGSAEKCDYGCRKGVCIIPGDPCNAESFTEICEYVDVDGNGTLQMKDTKLTCVDGKVAEMPCGSCAYQGSQQVTCKENQEEE
ncbi:MAG: hypothetical protein IKY83_13150 [Proteobacteria bacterium]|nr:hypothetical protein [Pseudomonadota bacterium]